MSQSAPEATATTTTTTGQPEGGSNGKSTTTGFDVTRAFFGGEGTQSEHESPESGNGAPPESGEGATDPESDDGTENAGDSGGGESGSGGESEVWQFDGAEYTQEQVADALKQRGMYERFNQTITPLITSVQSYEETARRLGVMAQTEAEKEIAELQRELASGKLDSRDYQQAHMQLTRAQQRLDILRTAADQESKQRQQTLNEARTHNARQVGVGLIKSGWTMSQINDVQGLAQEFMTPDQFADSLSAGLMEAFKDALELRRMRTKAADELRGKAKKAVKVDSAPKATPTKAPKGSGVGSSEWIGKHFWGR